MKKKILTEQELLESLDAESVHADELFKPLTQELTPLERISDSVVSYERPFDSAWDDYFDSDEGVSDDFMVNREQPTKGSE